MAWTSKWLGLYLGVGSSPTWKTKYHFRGPLTHEADAELWRIVRFVAHKN